MDYKKVKTENTARTRDIKKIEGKATGNIYETTVILAKRANQISVEMKDELHKKLDEFATNTDNLDEVFENREQIEIARFYEQIPKPTLISTYELMNDKVYYRKPKEEEKN